MSAVKAAPHSQEQPSATGATVGLGAVCGPGCWSVVAPGCGVVCPAAGAGRGGANGGGSSGGPTGPVAGAVGGMGGLGPNPGVGFGAGLGVLIGVWGEGTAGAGVVGPAGAGPPFGAGLGTGGGFGVGPGDVGPAPVPSAAAGGWPEPSGGCSVPPLAGAGTTSRSRALAADFVPRGGAANAAALCRASRCAAVRFRAVRSRPGSCCSARTTPVSRAARRTSSATRCSAIGTLPLAQVN